MNRFASLSILLAACTAGERAETGQCPAGEVCSSETPNGLHFIGEAMVDQIWDSGPAPTAIGGTQQVDLQYDRGTGVLRPLDIAYAADADAADGVAIAGTSGPTVTVRGVGSRENYLRITDPATDELFDRKMLAGAALTQVQAIAPEFESLPIGASIAFLGSESVVGIAMFGDVQESGGPQSERIVDHGAVLAAAGATQATWDSVLLDGAPVGPLAISVTAGDKPAATVTVDVVDHVDSIESLTADLTIHGGNTFCFGAKSSAKYVVGLTWTFTVDGATLPPQNETFERNCISISTDKTSGTIAVTASAAGKSDSVSIAVMPGAAVRIAPHHVARATAGDRAAM